MVLSFFLLLVFWVAHGVIRLCCRSVHSILKEHGVSQSKWIVCTKWQSQSRYIVRSAVITSVMTVLVCRVCMGEREGGCGSYRHDKAATIYMLF